MKQAISKGISLLFACVFVYACANLVQIGYDYWNNRTVLAEAQQLYDRSNSQTARQGKEGTALQDLQQSAFSGLHAINDDIVGWIFIGGTNIDYPVLQGRDNEYYLNRNYKGEETRAGSIFMDYRNHIGGEERNRILYGHRMKDSSMFSDLTAFTDQSFFYNQPDMFYDTTDAQYDIEVFSVYQTKTDFYYIETDFQSDDAYEAFLTDIQERSLFQTETEVTVNDQIITLSTCDYRLHPTEGRLVVHGKLIERSSG
ncbi:MAG: class B sortase [Shouchella clausii]|uniref:class B sortase n=1 Tax=Shouchella clausii TaxID=79880 RepID=UPI000BA529D4|nr:class B sortase [Shouchella clausii]PAF13154.1 SrtB family sortase [Shouchella clausii]